MDHLPNASKNLTSNRRRTNILLDGGENVDTFTAAVGQSVPLDSVQEYRVITNDFSAKYGRATGGIVDVATRSGTNEFHGTGSARRLANRWQTSILACSIHSIPSWNYGIVLVLEKRYQEAEKELRKAVSRDESAQAHYFLGVTWCWDNSRRSRQPSFRRENFRATS